MQAAEVVSGSAQEATGDTLRSAIVAAGVRSSVVVDGNGLCCCV